MVFYHHRLMFCVGFGDLLPLLNSTCQVRRNEPLLDCLECQSRLRPIRSQGTYLDAPTSSIYCISSQQFFSSRMSPLPRQSLDHSSLQMSYGMAYRSGKPCMDCQ